MKNEWMDITYASTQQKKQKAASGPANGILPIAKETTIDVKTITTR